MPSRSRRFRLVLPRLFTALLAAAVVLTILVAVGVAAVRWSHHVAAFVEIAAIVIGGGIVLVVVSRRLLGGAVSPGTILELDLEEPLDEAAPSPPAGLRSLGGTRRQTLRDVIEALDRAARDRHIAALFVRVGRFPRGLAQIQELRDAVTAFRAGGKRAVAFSETFGEGSPGNGAYYLATAFDEIVLQPSGDVNLTGVMASATFVRGTLDKLGIVPRMDHRHEYKTAMNLLTEAAFTPAHRENLEQVARSQFEQIVRGIAGSRNIPEPDVPSLIDQGPFLADAAHEAGLVDRLAYRDQVIAAMKAQAGAKARLLHLSHYAKRTRKVSSRGDTIAMIMGVGGVRRGKTGGFHPLDSGRPLMGSDTVAAAFRAAVDNKKVRAILFRIDSPGGSYVASDTIWRETVRAREAGKPVIVSMGNVAGSGGYFVAMAADKIVAQPGTLTGSIGVIAGKAVTTNLRAKVGLSTDEVHTSSHATMWSDTVDYTPEEWDRVQRSLDRVYEDFTSKVAACRGLSLDTVQQAAKGRVWTGDEAKRLGLIDELGGYSAALELVREAIGRPGGAAVRIKLFPRPPRLVDRLFPGRVESSEDNFAADISSDISPASITGELFRLASPVARSTAGLGSGAALVMPRFEVDL